MSSLLQRRRSLLTAEQRQVRGFGAPDEATRMVLGQHARVVFEETWAGRDVRKHRGQPGAYFGSPGAFLFSREDRAGGANRGRRIAEPGFTGWRAGFLQDRNWSLLSQYNYESCGMPTWEQAEAIGLSDHYSVADGVLSITPRYLTPAQRATAYMAPATVVAAGSGYTPGPRTLTITAGTTNAGDPSLSFYAVAAADGTISIPYRSPAGVALGTGPWLAVPDYIRGQEPTNGTYGVTSDDGSGSGCQVSIAINWRNVPRFASLALTSHAWGAALGAFEVEAKHPPYFQGGWGAPLWLFEHGDDKGEIDPNEFVYGTGSATNIYAIQQHAHNPGGYGASQNAPFDPTAQFGRYLAVAKEDIIEWYVSPGRGLPWVKSSVNVLVSNVGRKPLRPKQLIVSYTLGDDSGQAFGGCGCTYAGTASPPPMHVGRVRIYDTPDLRC